MESKQAITTIFKRKSSSLWNNYEAKLNCAQNLPKLWEKKTGKKNLHHPSRAGKREEKLHFPNHTIIKLYTTGTCYLLQMEFLVTHVVKMTSRIEQHGGPLNRQLSYFRYEEINPITTVAERQFQIQTKTYFSSSRKRYSSCFCSMQHKVKTVLGYIPKVINSLFYKNKIVNIIDSLYRACANTYWSQRKALVTECK